MYVFVVASCSIVVSEREVCSCVGLLFLCVHVYSYRSTEVLSILATEKVRRVKRSHTIIEFVAVWSV